MPYRYKVVPFIGQSRGRLSAADVADQLEHAISRHASEGWEFFQLSDVNIEVQPGCLSGLFGAKVQYVRFDQLIFRREMLQTEHSEKRPTQPMAEPLRAGAEPNANLAPSVPLSQDDAKSVPERKPWLSPFCHHCGADIPVGIQTCPACRQKL